MPVTQGPRVDVYFSSPQGPQANEGRKMLSTTIIVYALAATLAARILLLLYQRLASPLHRIPGPFWARYTRGWYFYRVSKGQFEKETLTLHKQYGSVVRLAPGWYSCNSTDALKKIYAPGSKFTKSDWYDGWRHPHPSQWTLFTDKNNKRHGETKKRFSALYSLSSLVSYEPFVDLCVDLFIDRLREFSKANTEIDLGYWMQCYTFDVIGCITYGERYGFLDKGEDIQGVIKAVGSIGPFSTIMGIFSEWYPLAFKINGYFNGSGAGGRTFVANFNRQKIQEHKQQQQEAQVEKGVDHITDKTLFREPFMTKLIRSQRENPEKITDYHLFMVAQSNIIAGFDTTAISLTATMYHLLRTPRVLQRLRDEIKQARECGKLADDGTDRITFHESQELPYFKAVMKEALRIHSATGLPLWRVVPEGGVEIDGIHFPQGTVLGVNSWATHYNEDVFTDPAEFRPERWLDSDEARLKAMNELYMPFGLGSRTCLGRHISTLEMSKLIPILIDKFDFDVKSSLAKEEDWETQNFWFVKPRNFRVQVHERN